MNFNKGDIVFYTPSHGKKIYCKVYEQDYTGKVWGKWHSDLEKVKAEEPSHITFVRGHEVKLVELPTWKKIMEDEI